MRLVVYSSHMIPSPHSTLVSDPAAYARGVPHDEFARLRQAGPIVWVKEVPLWRHSDEYGQMVSGAGYWAVTRHAAIVSISRQPAVFSSSARGAFMADPKSPEDLERTRQLLINMDAPEHTRLRQAVTSVFTPVLVNGLRASIRAHACALVQRMLDRGSFDLVRDVAAELPLLVLADLLGIPYADRELLYQWSNQLVGFDDAEYGGGHVERYQRAYAEAYQYAMDVARVRRRRPGDDLVSRLLQSASVPLSDGEMCHLWVLLVVGGNESTRHLLSGALQALCEWPEQRQRLGGAPNLCPTAVEEFLRWVSPVMQFRRTVTRDVSFEGQRLSEGDKVVLYYVSANRDPERSTDERLVLVSRAPPAWRRTAFLSGRQSRSSRRPSCWMLGRTCRGSTYGAGRPSQRRTSLNSINRWRLARPAVIVPQGRRARGAANYSSACASHPMPDRCALVTGASRESDGWRPSRRRGLRHCGLFSVGGRRGRKHHADDRVARREVPARAVRRVGPDGRRAFVATAEGTGSIRALVNNARDHACARS